MYIPVEFLNTCRAVVDAEESVELLMHWDRSGERPAGTVIVQPHKTMNEGCGVLLSFASSAFPEVKIQRVIELPQSNEEPWTFWFRIGQWDAMVAYAIRRYLDKKAHYA